MKKPMLFLLLAWIMIYAGNHLLFIVPKNSDVGTALRSQAASEMQEIDSWGPYLPGIQATDDQKPDVASMKALAASQKADRNLRSDKRVAENLASSDPSELQPSPANIPPTPTRKPDVVSSISSTDPRIQARNVVGLQKRRMVTEQKKRVARASNPSHNIPRSSRNMPEEAWFPGPPPHASRFGENSPEGFPSPPPRWRSGMFMFAPPDF